MSVRESRYLFFFSWYFCVFLVKTSKRSVYSMGLYIDCAHTGGSELADVKAVLSAWTGFSQGVINSMALPVPPQGIA